MSAKRQRMTWASQGRSAAAAPAIPGYGVEDQDHPAHTQDDPEAPDYMIGGPSEFAEDVHPGPYGDSGRPALPGVGVEDQDHPAHQGQVGRQANLMAMVRQKAAKALKLAKATLGKKAAWASVEDQAFNFMSMDDSALDASLGRLSGGFLAEDEDEGEIEPEVTADFGMEAEEVDPVMARLEALETEVMASRRANRRRADQNDPTGKTLGTSGKSEEEAKAEEKAVSGKSARAKLARLFTACDLDNDGFVTEEDWMGPPEVFASLDRDRDGILARHEVLAGEVPEAFKKQWEDKGDDKDEKKDDDKDEKKDDDKDEKKAALARLVRQAKKLAAEIEEEEVASKKGGKKSEIEEEVASKKGGKKSEIEEKIESKKGGKKSEIEEKIESKKGGKKAADDTDEDGTDASKKAFGHFAEFDENELSMMAEMDFDGLDDGATACGDVMASKKAEDDGEGEGGEPDGDEESDKEASFFSTGFDPMGLADGTSLTAADKAAFAEVFGKQAEDDDDDGEAPEAEEPAEKATKEASRRLASLLKPQPRKPSTGVRSVGTQARVASGRNEVAELSNLWASDPDVSGSFS